MHSFVQKLHWAITISWSVLVCNWKMYHSNNIINYTVLEIKLWHYNLFLLCLKMHQVPHSLTRAWGSRHTIVRLAIVWPLIDWHPVPWNNLGHPINPNPYVNCYVLAVAEDVKIISNVRCLNIWLSLWQFLILICEKLASRSDFTSTIAWKDSFHTTIGIVITCMLVCAWMPNWDTDNGSMRWCIPKIISL